MRAGRGEASISAVCVCFGSGRGGGGRAVTISRRGGRCTLADLQVQFVSRNGETVREREREGGIESPQVVVWSEEKSTIGRATLTTLSLSLHAQTSHQPDSQTDDAANALYAHAFSNLRSPPHHETKAREKKFGRPRLQKNWKRKKWRHARDCFFASRQASGFAPPRSRIPIGTRIGQRVDPSTRRPVDTPPELFECRTRRASLQPTPPSNSAHSFPFLPPASSTK